MLRPRNNTEKNKGWIIEPYLHIGSDRIYNPLTDRSMRLHEIGYQEFTALLAGTVTLESMSASLQKMFIDHGWLVENHPALSQRFLLRVVALEGTSQCNQACYFCPVATHPRKPVVMPLDVYKNVVAQLADYQNTIKAVFMNHYNEPTIDQYFIERVRILKKANLSSAVNTNGTGLTPAKVDAIIKMGGLRYISINLSTVNRERYIHERTKEHLQLVLHNLEYMQHHKIAQEMDIAVLGRGDRTHQDDFKLIQERFAESHFNVRYFKIMNRAGNLAFGQKSENTNAALKGCENLGSRPLQHLHITAQGKCVLCCQDYYENYVVGDLTQQSVTEVLTGPILTRMRRWSYGIEKAPDDFICHKCIFALRT